MHPQSRRPEFARVGFHVLDIDLVWDPVADTLTTPAEGSDDTVETIHRCIRGAWLTHLTAHEVVAATLTAQHLEFEFFDIDPGPAGPESEDLPPGAIA